MIQDILRLKRKEEGLGLIIIHAVIVVYLVQRDLNQAQKDGKSKLYQESMDQQNKLGL